MGRDLESPDSESDLSRVIQHLHARASFARPAFFLAQRTDRGNLAKSREEVPGAHGGMATMRACPHEQVSARGNRLSPDSVGRSSHACLESTRHRRPRSVHAPSTLAALRAHLRVDGIAVAFAFLWRTIGARLLPTPRDPGERAAERFLRALGYRILLRNWRSARDARDEADLVALSPDHREVVIVEVKRAAGPWDALGRVDSRKKEVLWRLLLELESARMHGSGASAAVAHALAGAEFIRVDLVGVRGTGRTASVVNHDCGIFLRTLKGPRTGHPP